MQKALFCLNQNTPLFHLGRFVKLGASKKSGFFFALNIPNCD